MIDFLKELFKVQSQDAEAKQIAKHLSKVLLWEWKGTNALYPDVKDKAELLVKKMVELKMPIEITETFRSAKKQNELPSNSTKARGLESYHQYGLAFDIKWVLWLYSPPSSNWWEILGKEGEKLGLTWGGRWTSFPDKLHFQWDMQGKIKCQDLKPYFE